VIDKEALEDVVKKIEHYLFNWSDKIGKGSFSEVYMGVNELTNQQVAIKVIKNESVKSKTAQRLLQHEIGILKTISHPNVIHCLDVFSSINNCYIITEFCADGDL
jgi:serine/threonine-protein kinase ULK/ATG1